MTIPCSTSGTTTNKDKVMGGGSSAKRVAGEGRKPFLGTLKEMISLGIVDLRLKNEDEGLV